jgi:hypothetical protein
MDRIEERPVSSEPLTDKQAEIERAYHSGDDRGDLALALVRFDNRLRNELGRLRTRSAYYYRDLAEMLVEDGWTWGPRAARSATPSSEEDEDERKASEFREIEDDAPTYADGCTVPLDRDGIAIFPIPEHVHEPPLATPDNAGRSLDVERLAEAICGSRLPFVEEDGDLYVDDACRSWARKAIAEYARLSESTGSEEGR